MNVDTFFKKFELFADAPNAVGKMRELVLDLAVSGRLCDCDSDGPGSELVSLAKIASFINGDRGKNYPSAVHRTDSGVPFVNAGHLRNGNICMDDMDYISEERFELLGGGKFQPGDVIYCLRGSLGKCAVVRNVLRGAIASSLLILRPAKDILTEYLYYFLISPAGIRMIKKYDNGSAQPNLSATNVKKFGLSLPPLAEQKRIVAKVDELMALCDRLEAQQQERETRHTALAHASLTRFADAPTPENLELLFHKAYSIEPGELRKTIIALAVQGRLIPQNADDGTAAAFVHHLQIQRRASYEDSRIAAEKAHARLPKRPPNDFSPHVVQKIEGIPTGWCETRIADIADCLDSLRIPVNKGERLGSHGNIPYYGANGQVGWIDKYLFNEPLVLVVEDETFIGRVKPFSYVIYGKSWVNNHAHVLRPLAGISAEYLNLCLCQYPFIPLTSGTTGRRKLTQASLLNARLWFAPLPEQKRIVAKVDQLMALVDQLEVQLAEARGKAAALLDAVVAELSVAA